jgi:hypothetical protein
MLQHDKLDWQLFIANPLKVANFLIQGGFKKQFSTHVAPKIHSSLLDAGGVPDDTTLASNPLVMLNPNEETIDHTKVMFWSNVAADDFVLKVFETALTAQKVTLTYLLTLNTNLIPALAHDGHPNQCAMICTGA